MEKKSAYTFFPWCTYTDPELASVGMNEKTAKEVCLEDSVFSEAFKDNDRSLAEREKSGKIKRKGLKFFFHLKGRACGSP